MSILDQAFGAIEAGGDPKKIKRHFEETVNSQMEEALVAGASYDDVLEMRIDLQKRYNERADSNAAKDASTMGKIGTTMGKVGRGAKAFGKALVTGTELFGRNLDILGTELGLNTMPDLAAEVLGVKSSKSLEEKSEALKQVKQEALSSPLAQEFPRLTGAGMVAGELLPDIAVGRGAVSAVDTAGKGLLTAGKAIASKLPKGRVAKLNLKAGVSKAAAESPSPGMLKEIGKGIKEGGVTGATVGGLQDPGEVEDRGADRLRQAALGGTIGTVAGGAGSGVISGIPAMSRRVGKPFEEAMRTLRGAAKLEQRTKNFSKHIDPEEQLPGVMDSLYAKNRSDAAKIALDKPGAQKVIDDVITDLTKKGTTSETQTVVNRISKTNLSGIETLDDLLTFKRTQLGPAAFGGEATIMSPKALTAQQDLVTKFDDFILEQFKKNGNKQAVAELKQANYLFKRQLTRKNVDEALVKSYNKDRNIDTRKFATQLDNIRRTSKFIKEDPFLDKAFKGAIRTVRAQKNLPQFLQRYKPKRTSGEEAIGAFRNDNVKIYQNTARTALMSSERRGIIAALNLTDTLFTPKGLRIWYNIGTAQKPARQIAKLFNYIVGQQAGQQTTQDDQ